MIINSLANNLAKIKNKKVILRLDLNVPLAGSRIVNDYKLLAALPTIKLLQKLNCAIIIVTHLGEPELTSHKELLAKYSVKPIVSWLNKKLKTKIIFPTLVWSKIKQSAKELAPGEIMMLENIRLFPGEITNQTKLAQNLASLADIYVNDALAVAHRNHASVSAIKKYLPSFAGPLMVKEITNLDKVRHGKKPFVLIMGGAKLTTKLALLKKLAPQANQVLVGGGLIKPIVKNKKLNIKNIVLPIDVGILKNNQRVNKDLKQLTDKDVILDLGPKTIKLFSTYLKKAKTIFWNGPMGVFEQPAFSLGTKKVAGLLAQATKRGTFTVIGGGETLAATAAQKKNFSWVSTAGGAALAYLEGKNLPGLKKLVKF